MRQVLGVVLLLAIAWVAWHLLALVTGLIFSLLGVLVLIAAGYVVYRLVVRGG